MVEKTPNTPKQNRPTVIYALTCPDTGEIRYVGKTCRVMRERLNAHYSQGNHKLKYPVSLWIWSLIQKGKRPSHIVLEVVQPGAGWAEREKFWISHHKSDRLLNVHIGGEGGFEGCTLTDEHKEKIRQKHKGRSNHWLIGKCFRSPEGKAKAAEAVKRSNARPEIREKLIARNKLGIGRKDSPETTARRAAKMRGRKHSEETKAKMAKAARERSQEVRAKSGAAISAAFARRRASLAQVAAEVSPILIDPPAITTITSRPVQLALF